MNTPTLEPFVTIDQLASHLSVSTKTLRRWRDEGMPHYMRGSTLRFRVSEVEDWMRRTDPPSPSDELEEAA